MPSPSICVRNFVPGDIEKIREFVDHPAGSSPGKKHMVSPLVKMELGRPGYLPQKDLFLSERGREVVGYCDIESELEIGRVILDGFVAPEFRREGVGKKMVSEVLRRAHEINARVAHVPVPECRQEARVFLQKQGFFQVRIFFEMELKLSEIREKKIAASFYNKDRFEAGEEDHLAKLQNRVFSEAWGFCPNSEEDIRYYHRLVGSKTEDVLVLRESSGIVGYIWPHLIAERAPRSIGKRGRIHMWGVVGEQRGEGKGRELLLLGLSWLAEMGAESAELSVDSRNLRALSLYDSLGFKMQARTIWYEKKVAGR